jgi:plastocyanin
METNLRSKSTSEDDMKASINRAALEQTSFDSALPSGAAAVVHRFEQEGRYSVALVAEGDEVVDTRTIFVEPSRRSAEKDAVLEPPRPGPERASAPDSVVIDVGVRPRVAGRAAVPEQPPVVALSAGGYASFTAPSGRSHRVVVTRIGTSREQETEFDSTRLRASDVFAVTLLRPGAYIMKNAIGGHGGRVVVTYPKVGRGPYRPAEALVVDCDENGFRPDAVTIGPAQGIVFKPTAECRITVELVEPDDGPPGTREQRRPPLARRLLRPVPRQGTPGE